MTKPTGLKIFLPKSVPDDIKIKTPESGVLTILLSGGKRIYYYEGANPNLMRLVSQNEIRQVILNKKRRTIPEKFMVIIKPGRDSDFHMLIKIMDEMTINQVNHYALVEIESLEYNLMQQR